jgi:uncharacterized protein GlcG (DUF336 family)
MDSADLSPSFSPVLPYINIEHSNGGLIIFLGGVIIKSEKGEVIGSIGVSGSTVENDHSVAAACAIVK